jgi:SAM-dependent methyltransferase
MSKNSTNLVCKTIEDILNKGVHARILEIGAASGGTTKKILSLIGDKGKLYCCDPFVDYQDKKDRDNDAVYLRFQNSVKNISNKENFYFKRDKSEIFLKSLVDMGLERSFDLIFIDGDHSTKAVISDFKYSHTLIKDGGIIIFDDWNWIARHMRSIPNIEPPVNIAIEKILIENNKYYDILGVSGSSFSIRKKKEI